ncbi:DUF695 domain-containing protein [Candidatus Marinarcus aquaticus]|uniref:DUF695 domain-containing protein n=1 Tax=Candidatus Marinarcus aquaticus TaxID=2044504 RepID=A0A4Q0XVH3_9BACT|nr:DUF695 domain-containing protein [Candidatus Marinarcus aquaticus]RXJ58183.1 hypothetical protein CRV04_06655 [Candidatus Marinarcus aquaticus]
MENEDWRLVHTNDINQILKVRTHIIDKKKSVFKELLIIKHQYTTSDDVLFPEVSTLGFLNSLEQQALLPLEKEGVFVFVATNIAKGNIELYLYCKDAKSAVMLCIETLKKMPAFKVEFEIRNDPNWSQFILLNV